MIRAAQNVREAESDESSGGLIPLRGDAHQPRIADQLERTNVTARRQEPQRRHGVHAEPREGRVDRESRAVRVNAVLELDVDEALVPHQLRAGRQPGGVQVRERVVVRHEGLVGRQRHARGQDAGIIESRAPLEDRQVGRDPQAGGVEQVRIDRVELQVSRTGEAELDVAHRAHRRADEQMQLLAVRLEEQLDEDVGGNVVGTQPDRRQAEKREKQHGTSHCVQSILAPFEGTYAGYAHCFGRSRRGVRSRICGGRSTRGVVATARGGRCAGVCSRKTLAETAAQSLDSRINYGRRRRQPRSHLAGPPRTAVAHGRHRGRHGHDAAHGGRLLHAGAAHPRVRRRGDAREPLGRARPGI